MRALTAEWIAQAVGGTLVADPAIVVTSVVKDSRAATQGSLYLAFPGEKVDGHDFVDAASALGASLCLVTRPVPAPHVLVDDATVTSHIKRIRRKFLAVDAAFDEIDTVHGAGYRWRA